MINKNKERELDVQIAMYFEGTNSLTKEVDNLISQADWPIKDAFNCKE